MSLYQNCVKFEKMADVSVVKNTSPILDELSNLEDYDDRVEFAKERWEKLGEGSARAVFRVNKELIIKVAINDKGIAQNKLEMQPKMQTDCVNKIVLADAMGKWLVMPFTNSITKESFKEIVGFGFDSFMTALFYKFNAESDKWSPPRQYEEIEQNELFKCLAQLVLENDLIVGDIDKTSSFGELNGKIVLRDFGISREIFSLYYEKDKSSDVKTTRKST